MSGKGRGKYILQNLETKNSGEEKDKKFFNANEEIQ